MLFSLSAALSPLLLACSVPQATADARPIPRGELLVSGYNDGNVHRFQAGSGVLRGALGPGSVPGAQRVRLGRDGLLYACAESIDAVLRFQRDGTFVDAFVTDDPNTPGDETGGLAGPTGLAFDPGGRLYVASFDSDAVLRYDGATGAFLDVFVPAGRGGLDGPDAGMTFGPDGHLWVPSFNGDGILRYHRTDGRFLGDVAAGSPLLRPRDLVFHRGSLYVSSWGSNRILRFDATGTYLGVFASSVRPTGMAFQPWNGDLYVTSDQSDNVRIHDGTTGAFRRAFVPPGANGLDAGTNLLWLADLP